MCQIQLVNGVGLIYYIPYSVGPLHYAQHSVGHFHCMHPISHCVLGHVYYITHGIDPLYHIDSAVHSVSPMRYVLIV